MDGETFRTILEFRQHIDAGGFSKLEKWQTGEMFQVIALVESKKSFVSMA